jgi:hypothetical protein
MVTVVERFEALVDRSGPHEVWRGAADRNGVPQMRVEGRLTTARRAAWELERGPLPQGVRIRGCAGAPRCVRVDHLTLTESRSPRPRTRRLRGSGSIREVRLGVWQLTVTTASGDRAFRTITGDHADAERELARLAAQYGHAPTTLDSLIVMHHAHLNDAGRSRATLRRYQQLWRTWLAPSLGTIAPNDLRPADVEHTLARMHHAERSARSIHQAAVVLNTALAWACEQHLVHSNPVVGCNLPNGATVTAARHR